MTRVFVCLNYIWWGGVGGGGITKSKKNINIVKLVNFLASQCFRPLWCSRTLSTEKKIAEPGLKKVFSLRVKSRQCSCSGLFRTRCFIWSFGVSRKKLSWEIYFSQGGDTYALNDQPCRSIRFDLFIRVFQPSVSPRVISYVLIKIQS
jgi:hypothetical protein